jgi:hypothetical protein
MPRKRALPEDAEVAISGTIEPVLVNGGATIKSMSAAFMADVERAWRKHGPKVLDVLAEKYPQAFFAGMVAMTKVIRWETGADAASFSRTMTPEQVMDKLEERVGPEGRVVRAVYQEGEHSAGEAAIGGAGTDGSHRTLRRTGAGLARQPL